MADGMSRREFLKTVARAALLAGIGALGAKLVAGDRRPRAERCVGDGVCSGCSAFAGCGLPQALSARGRADRARRPS